MLLVLSCTDSFFPLLAMWNNLRSEDSRNEIKTWASRIVIAEILCVPANNGVIIPRTIFNAVLLR